MMADVSEFVIQGVTEQGEIVEPDDWWVKLLNQLNAAGGEGHVEYVAYVRPIVSAGIHCAVVLTALEQVDARAFLAVQAFVKAHQLKVRAGRGSRYAEVTGVHRALNSERRHTD
jgi:hypothetical protein